MPQGQPPSSTIVGNCIACQGLVRVPSTINAQSNVRCPHCQETFAIGILLDQLVPELEIISPNESDSENDKPPLYIDKQVDQLKDDAGKFVVPSQLAKGARRRGRSKSRRSRSRSSRDPESHSSDRTDERSRSSSNSNSSSRSNSTAPQTDAAQIAGSERTNAREVSFERQRSSSSRSSARVAERNSAFEFIKVMAGAALAIPIAYLVVLWAFGQDPLALGRPIGNAAPFLVPEKYRADRAGAADNNQKDSPSSEPSADFEMTPDSDLSNIGKESLDGLLD